VRSDSKASSAGSTTGQGISLGSFVRGAFAIRGASGDADGSGALAGRGAAPRLLVLLGAILATAMILASSAFAAETRPATGLSFGPDGAGGSASFAGLRSLAIDQASGDVYAYDSSAQKVYKFDASGAPLTFAKTGTNAISGVGGGGGGAEFQVAVAPAGAPGGTAGDIYVANNGSTVGVYSPEGESLGTLSLNGETCGVATNPAGHLFTGSYPSLVTEFTPAANPVVDGDKSGESTGVMQSLCNVAAGPSGIYGFRYSGGALKISSLADATAEEIDPSAATGAVDPVDGTFYADRRNSVKQYDAAGSLVLGFGEEISESFGVAVRHSTDRVYVANQGKISVFGSPAVVPTTTTEAPAEVLGASATLKGTVNPSGLPLTGCSFRYGHGEQLNLSAPCEQSVPTDEADHAVSAHVTGLEPGQGYNFRLAATNANGSSVGATEFFITVRTAETSDATGIAGQGAVLNGVVRPAGVPIGACFFEYGPTDAYGSTVPCAEAVPTDEAEHPVSAAIGGLEFGARHYHFRLVVEQAGEELGGGDRELTTPGPEVTFARTATVGTEAASVEAGILPRGEEVEYFIEYGPTTSYGQTTDPVSVGGAEGVTVVSQALTGLASGTAYHWRIVLETPNGSASGPDRAFLTRTPGSGPETGCSNQIFRSGPGGALPDCRAYERVTPRNKNGNSIQHDTNVVRASNDGSRLTYVANSGIPTSAGGSSTNFASARGAGGWSAFGLNPTIPASGFGRLVGFDENVGVSLFTGRGIIVSQVASGETLENELGGAEAQAEYGDSAEDPNRFTFESNRALAPGAIAGVENDYFFDHGAITLVGRIPAGNAISCDDQASPACIPSPNGANIGAYDWQKGGAPGHEGGVSSAYYPENTTSDDGSKAIFTSGSGQIYVREDGTSTTKVSASQRTTPDPNGGRPASYMWTTPDGGRVFFGSCEKLTNDSTAFSTASNSCNDTGGGNAIEQGQDLYEFDTTTGDLKDLTVDHDPADPKGAAVLGLVGASADGSYVYFAANGALGTGAQPGTCRSYSAGQGKCNLYLAHDGAITFIARLDIGNTGDYTDWQQSAGTSGSYRWKTARVSASGTVIFSSKESLTGYPNVNCVEGFGELFPCAEIYRYAPGDSGPACISCDPSGAAPTGHAELESRGNSFGALLSTWILTRNISSDGKRAFFDSPDQLVAADHNAVKDVYEWEASGSGSCTSAEVSGGCLYLLSDGDSPSPSYFGDNSRSGDDAFFFTDAQLVPDDQDALVDAYDARVGGGLAEQNRAATSPPCSGEACKGAATVAPSESSPGSATFAGPTNQKEVVKPQCRKGAKSCRKHKKHNKKRRGQKSSPGKSHGNRGGSK